MGSVCASGSVGSVCVRVAVWALCGEVAVCASDSVGSVCASGSVGTPLCGEVGVWVHVYIRISMCVCCSFEGELKD